MTKPVKWEVLDKQLTQKNISYLKFFLHEDDQRSASEQINERYRYGSWHNFKGFKHLGDGVIQFQDAPVDYPIAKAHLRAEVIYAYRYDWIAVFQPDGSFEVSRVN